MLDNIPVELAAIIEDMARSAYERGLQVGEQRVMKGLSAVAHLNGSANRILKALPADDIDTTLANDPKPGAPHDDEPADVHAAVIQAMIEHAEKSINNGEDPTDGVHALLDLLDDPDQLAEVLGTKNDTETVQKSLYWLVLKSWSEDLHPRDDNGRFVGKDKLQEAKSDPKVAAELRKRVTKPEQRAKLDKIISGEADPGRTKRGQAKHEAGQRRQAKRLASLEAKRLVGKVMDGAGTAEDVEAIAEHINSGLNRDQIGYLGVLAQQAKGGGRRREEMVSALLDHVRGIVTPKEPVEPDTDTTGRRVEADLGGDERPDAVGTDAGKIPAGKPRSQEQGGSGMQRMKQQTADAATQQSAAAQQTPSMKEETPASAESPGSQLGKKLNQHMTDTIAKLNAGNPDIGTGHKDLISEIAAKHGRQGLIDAALAYDETKPYEEERQRKMFGRMSQDQLAKHLHDSTQGRIDTMFRLAAGGEDIPLTHELMRRAAARQQQPTPTGVSDNATTAAGSTPVITPATTPVQSISDGDVKNRVKFDSEVKHNGISQVLGSTIAEGGEKYKKGHVEVAVYRGEHGGKPVYRWQENRDGNHQTPANVGQWSEVHAQTIQDAYDHAKANVPDAKISDEKFHRQFGDESTRAQIAESDAVKSAAAEQVRKQQAEKINAMMKYMKKTKTSQGERYLHEFEADKGFWDNGHKKHGMDFVYPKKDPDGVWRVKIWGQTPQQTQQAIDKLKSMGAYPPSKAEAKPVVKESVASARRNTSRNTSQNAIAQIQSHSIEDIMKDPKKFGFDPRHVSEGGDGLKPINVGLYSRDGRTPSELHNIGDVVTSQGESHVVVAASDPMFQRGYSDGDEQVGANKHSQNLLVRPASKSEVLDQKIKNLEKDHGKYSMSSDSFSDHSQEIAKLKAERDSLSVPTLPTPTPTRHTAEAAIDGLKGLMGKFQAVGMLKPSEYAAKVDSLRATKEEIDGHLGRLNQLSASDLLKVARATNADATLTEKSPKAKIIKQISEDIRRRWKTADNIHH